MIINRNDILNQFGKTFRTTLINTLPGYKCLHLVGTTDPYGNTNLALFNSVFHVGANPPLLGMVCRPDTPDHDTLSNILATGCFTLNTVSAEWYAKAHQASASYPSGVSEFAQCGLGIAYHEAFKAPFVEQSVIKIGMELKKTIDIDLNGTTIIIGEISQIILDDALIDKDGYIDHQKAKTVTVAGLDSYFTAEAIGRLPYAKPGKEQQFDINKTHTTDGK